MTAMAHPGAALDRAKAARGSSQAWFLIPVWFQLNLKERKDRASWIQVDLVTNHISQYGPTSSLTLPKTSLVCLPDAAFPPRVRTALKLDP